MSIADHYTYRVHWSAEDREFVGTVAEMPSMSWLASDQLAALKGVMEIAREAAADMIAEGEQPPQPLAERTYSGKFVVRVPEETHRRLVVEAAEQGISLNNLATSRLSRA